MNGPYRVVWLRHLIEHDLAGFVLSAMEMGHGVSSITAATNEIDRLLSANPESQGESRDAGERILVVSPLAVNYEVHVDEHVVVILHVSYRPPRIDQG